MSQRLSHSPAELTSAANPVQPPPRFAILGGIALLVVTTCVAYLPALHGGFIWDDDLLLTENSLIKAPDGLYRIWFTSGQPEYYPISYTIFWLEWRLWGMNPTGYHVTNLLLHIAAALLIWTVLRKLSIPGGFLAALLFALHPVNVESVAWIFQCRGLLAAVFLLLSILWYFKADLESSPQFDEIPPAEQPNRLYRPGAGRWYWLSLLAFLLAMLSKGSVATLPVLLLGLVWWLRKGITRWDLARTGVFLLVAIALTRVNIWFLTHSANLVALDVSFTQRLAGAGAVVWFYLSKALVPIHLVFVYPQWNIQTSDLLWWLPLLAAAVLTAVLWWQRRTWWGRPLLFAWGIVCVALLPVMGFAEVNFMQFSLVADHYQYLALIAVVAVVATGWSAWHQQARGLVHTATIMIVTAATGTFTVLTMQQCKLYNDIITLWQTTLQKNPDSWLAHYNLGNALEQSGRLPEAIDQYQQALKLNPDYPKAHNNLGVALLNAGRLQEALEHFQQVVRFKPYDIMACVNVALTYAKMNHPAEAIATAEKALDLARSQGQTALAERIEAWLTSYRANQENHSQEAPRSEVTPVAP